MKKIVYSLIAGAVNPAPKDEGYTVITAGLEGAKTTLDGKKVLWTAGDAISVNGVSSEALSITEPTASATFAFPAVLAAEKKAVYPASAWASDGTITIAATQNAGTNASFAAEALPMVAYAASGNALSFKHVSALVKLQLKNGATSDNIDYVELSGNDGEQVSGVFAVNYETGELTPTSDAAADKVLRVSVGKALSSTATVIYVAIPSVSFTNGFKMKVVDVNGVTMTKRVGATSLKKGSIYPTPEDTFDADNTIKAFVKSYVRLIDVWENTTGTINLLTGETPATGDNTEYNVSNAHYIPSTTTITVGEKTYNTGDIYETALRCYLLVRGYDGTNTTKYGKNSIPALSGGAVGMSETVVTDTHGYYFGTAPYSETPGNGGYFYVKDGTDKIYHKAKVGVLDNWAMRSLNFQSGKPTTNICGYSGGQLTGYGGSFCPMRALISYAFFFKYMLDNGYDKGTDVASDVMFRCELFGKEGNY